MACELSKACVNILRISIDESFRNEFLESLGVTNSTDAEETLKIKLNQMHGDLHNQQETVENNAVAPEPTSSYSNSQNNFFNTRIRSLSQSSGFGLKKKLNEHNSGPMRASASENVPSQSILQNDEDEFGFWEDSESTNLESGMNSVAQNNFNRVESHQTSSISRSEENTGIIDHVIAENFLYQSRRMSSDIVPSQSVVRNEGDEFEFWKDCDNTNTLNSMLPQQDIESSAIETENEDFEDWNFI